MDANPADGLTADELSADELPDRERFRHLPEPVRLEDTITSAAAEPPADPYLGRDTERDFMLRYAGG